MKKNTNGSAPDWGAVHRVRVGHVRNLLRHRYGPVLPDDDAGIDDLRILLHCKANACKPENRVKALRKEIEAMAPWVPADKAREIAEQIAAKPLKVTSEWLGQALNVDIETREALRIWQIGAVGLDAAGRAQRNRERRRERDRERKRRQRACQPRSAWLEQNSASRTKPWEALGISRRTYYRHRSKTGGTDVSVFPVVTLAAPAVLCQPPARPRDGTQGGTGLSSMAREVLVRTDLCHPPNRQSGQTCATANTGKGDTHVPPMPAVMLAPKVRGRRTAA